MISRRISSMFRVIVLHQSWRNPHNCLSTHQKLYSWWLYQKIYVNIQIFYDNFGIISPWSALSSRPIENNSPLALNQLLNVIALTNLYKKKIPDLTVGWLTTIFYKILVASMSSSEMTKKGIGIWEYWFGSFK